MVIKLMTSMSKSMNTHQSSIKLLRRLWSHISQRRRRQFGMLLFLMLFASFAEIISIGAVLPFLSVLTAPENIFDFPAAKPLIEVLGLTSPSQLLLPLTLAFGLATLIAGASRLLLLWASTRLSFATGADLGISIYRRTLYQPYAVHCSRNSSEVISGISGKANSVINSVILPIITLISGSVMLIAILFALLSVEPIIAIAAFGGFGLIYIIIISITRKTLMADSECIARESVQVVKSLQEGLGGIRDVLIDGSQNAYCQIYRKSDISLRHAQGHSAFIGVSPRYAMEALGMLLIAFLAYTLAQQDDGLEKTIPILGALALGAQRLLPVLQQAYASWVSIKSGQMVLQDTLELLDQPLPGYANQPNTLPLVFEQSIHVNQLSFRYNPESPYVLKQINLTIPKGSRIGFIGTTGSGKSTLLDIIMGLLEPTSGTLEIDNQPIEFSNSRSWQSHIAHVPQAIFLSDNTIEENIAFGVQKDQIDQQRVKQAAQYAQIAESIESWPRQYQTVVGERGVRLSGGQRQRIGIARALYKQASVIIFDEATSALDNETELAVMQSIQGLSKDLTLLIIAHRLTTLKDCNQVVELSKGCIKRIGSYQDIVAHEASVAISKKGT
jgi:ATP-binding cassette, subfamily B, bacterial PglK